MSGLSTPASADPPPAPERPSYGPPGPYGPYGASGPYGPYAPYRAPGGPVPPNPVTAWLRLSAPDRRAGATPRVVLLALLTGLLTAWLLYDGLGANLLICGTATAVGAGCAARAAGRRIRPWTVVWSVLALVLLAVPVRWEAGWPTLLAVLGALGLASLALHGGRRWPGVLLALPGLPEQLVPAVRWAWTGMAGRSLPGRGRIVPVLKALAVAVALLTVFGLLFASADAAMADLLGGLSPDLDLGQLPARGLLFVLGTLTALGFARIAAGPRRWDRTVIRPGRERRRLEWALPLVALNLMFGVFVVLQAVVVLGGADAVLSNTGMSRSAYARQGFWQLSVITVLTLVVVAVAKRWAPRTTAADHRVARILLGLLCVLALAVVASALGRMWFYVDASGLTRLRLWVLVVEVWLGVVFLLLITAGLTRRTGWLPRVVVLSGMLTVAVYGLMGPDAIVAEQNVSRYEQALRTDPHGAAIDLRNVRDLSADAVPALDRLPEPQRSCALELIGQDLGAEANPWYATGASVARARKILAERPPVDSPVFGRRPCDRAGLGYEGW
ncbi:uncharacterized protein DUF4173 [Streptomyces sp. 1114.5]|uniref:DUF4153 domain-containing protein n=1 Tax=Streptomyces sp. 1114.5 TaxID=1938830 RepID=UPI000EABEED4|nr:DUF4173 domain-containing protein [Streptomyces sp. 1114.5]RKT10856.1 uncharacterized protein DUF4173 [Streptomyces sp. 1114.5]